jgi:short-subunit dehydrogenase
LQTETGTQVKHFADKVAAITGAGSGIGRALALALAERGAQLALSDVNASSLAQTTAAARARGVEVTESKVDVANREAVYAWAAQVTEDYGRVNMIVNNAGVAFAGTIDELDYADFEWIMGINFWGVVHGTKAFLPHLRASGEGHVVNVSSVFGLFAHPTQSAYNASKFAVRGFTEALRQELDLLDWPVSATVVHPGGIKTNIVQSIRFAAGMEDFLNESAEEAKAEFERALTTTPEQAARVILRAVEKNKRRVLIGRDAYGFDLVQRLFPSGYQRVLTTLLRSRRKQRTVPRTLSN